MKQEKVKSNLINCRKALEKITVTGAEQGGLLKGIANVLEECINGIETKPKCEEVTDNG